MKMYLPGLYLAETIVIIWAKAHVLMFIFVSVA
jgi:hypothetical protein